MVYLDLNNWWEFLSTPQKIFWLIAVVFSILFLVQFLLSLIGIDSDSDLDFELDGDADFDADPGYDIDKDFSVFSIRSIIAFFMFFGWTGAYLLGEGRSLPVTLGISTLSGLVAMSLVAYMIYRFSQLEKSGTLKIEHALDQEGEVYLTIPAARNGSGKVHLVIDGTLRELEASTEGGLLNTGSKIKVIDILENNVLLVEPMQLLEEADTEPDA